LHFGRAGGAARAELARQVLGAEVDGGDARIGLAQRRRVGDAGDRLEAADDEARLAARRVAVERRSRCRAGNSCSTLSSLGMTMPSTSLASAAARSSR